MGEDASLDDFLGDSRRNRPEQRSEGSLDATDADAESGSGRADPAPGAVTPTSTWRPGGRCDRCDEPAARRWRQGEHLVCATCSEWE